jgi:leader peptidase (prepilin peptidase) / N-methyltransferase
MTDPLGLASALTALGPTGLPWLAGLVGLLVGSFLNVVIHRLPLMMQRGAEMEAREILALDVSPDAPTLVAPPPFNLVTPRSRCPACGAPIRAHQNIPLLSWLWLRGRCGACQAPISVRYPLIELFTGVAFAVVAWQCGPTVETLYGCTIAALLLAMSGIDFDTQLLPDALTLPLLWLGLLAAVASGRGAAPFPVSPEDAIIGAIVGYLSLWTVFQAFKWITGREGMGRGDFKLLAALGAWLGWVAVPTIILLSSLVGALVGGFLILFRGRDRQIPIPYGPYLAAAGFICLLWGPALVAWYRELAHL